MAINEMNGTALHGIRLKVSLARRQPVYNPEKTKAAELATVNSSSSSGGANNNNSGPSTSNTPSKGPRPTLTLTPISNITAASAAANQSLSTPEAWSAMASNYADSADKPKNRAVVSYDEDDIYETI